MKNRDHTIQLGFTDREFHTGAHICQIFSDEDERQEILYKFLGSGVKSHDMTACFSDRETVDSLETALAESGIDAKQALEEKCLSLSQTDHVYFHNEMFEPDRMIKLLREFYEEALKNDFNAARVIGEMTPKIQKVPGGNQLLEYESRVSMLQRECPVTAMCQYDAREFDGATIMDILKVHPYMVVKGEIIENPFYIPPEEFFKQKAG